ncbi:MAG: hypothetical protein AAGH40_06205, partial [Verrucomicrobiota bacterium]
SENPRSAINEEINDEFVENEFSDLSWPLMTDPIKMLSPYSDSGAGATYYFDRPSSIAYHRAGYW